MDGKEIQGIKMLMKDMLDSITEVRRGIEDVVGRIDEIAYDLDNVEEDFMKAWDSLGFNDEEEE